MRMKAHRRSPMSTGEHALHASSAGACQFARPTERGGNFLRAEAALPRQTSFTSDDTWTRLYPLQQSTTDEKWPPSAPGGPVLFRSLALSLRKKRVHLDDGISCNVGYGRSAP